MNKMVLVLTRTGKNNKNKLLYEYKIVHDNFSNVPTAYSSPTQNLLDSGVVNVIDNNLENAINNVFNLIQMNEYRNKNNERNFAHEIVQHFSKKENERIPYSIFFEFVCIYYDFSTKSFLYKVFKK